tara:strand:- start:80533 stop:83709 length:3177 start_codon:yes stop_codon:yes gene_type:complete
VNNDLTLIEKINKNLIDQPEILKQEYSVAYIFLNRLNDEELINHWLRTSLLILEGGGRQWDAALQLFKSTEDVFQLLEKDQFIQWLNSGLGFSVKSSNIAAVYFSSSLEFFTKFRGEFFDIWQQFGLDLFKGTLESVDLVTIYFQKSYKLFEVLSENEFKALISTVIKISNRSDDIAKDCLLKIFDILKLLPSGRKKFLDLVILLEVNNFRFLTALFSNSKTLLLNVNIHNRVQLIDIIISIADYNDLNLENCLGYFSKSFSEIPENFHLMIIQYASQLTSHDKSMLESFLNSAPFVLKKISDIQFANWFNKGYSLYLENPQAGIAFFALESANSKQFLDEISSGVDLKNVLDLLKMYCQALGGEDVAVESSTATGDDNISWVSTESSSYGNMVFLPTRIDRYNSKFENYSMFKVVATHQVAHIEYGSFKFDFLKSGNVFNNIRQQVQFSTSQEEKQPLTDMAKFFNLFSEKQLALDIFTITEDFRLDNRVLIEYKGISNSYKKIQLDSLVNRPDIRSLPPRESLIELLLRYSLNQNDKLFSSLKNIHQAKNILYILNQLRNNKSDVEDSAEATLRIYSIIISIDQNDNQTSWKDISNDLDEDLPYIDDSEILHNLDTGQNDFLKDDDYQKMKDVEYRGDFKPEMGQLITDVQSQLENPQENDSDKITKEMLESALEQNADSTGEDSGDLSDGLKAMIQKLSMEMMNQEQFSADPNKMFSEKSSDSDLSDNSESLKIHEEGTFLYDEWDFKVRDYRVDWCLVKEKFISEGNSEYYDRTLLEYSSMVTKIKRQFEQITPEMYRKVRKLDDGEEIDIDDVIEAMIDIKSGVGPSEKLYWKRNKVQRDVAVLFLLDTSASTAEAISDASSYVDSSNIESNLSRTSYKRIIDVEKEAVVLLINAIESLGDMYGIYGFSGYGRENVEFYTVKDIEEPFSDTIKGRVESISPLHATRMGPAIRHATTKLDRVDARTKLLFLISDGRPQDRGYSREGVEKEYGVHDTKMALDEAKNKNINAFCLTVDKTGHDYLKTMCQDMAYEILDDIHILPERLLYLYRRLTT